MRTTKFNYLLVIQGNYGDGWEDLSQYDAKTERGNAYQDLKEYRLAESRYASHKIIHRREPNPEHPDNFPTWYFDYGFEISMSENTALLCSAPGRDAHPYVTEALPTIKTDHIQPDDLRKELDQYGAWDDDELNDHDENLLRIIWIAAGHIREELES